MQHVISYNFEGKNIICIYIYVSNIYTLANSIETWRKLVSSIKIEKLIKYVQFQFYTEKTLIL